MRKIQEHLSRNIKKRRSTLGCTQAQLAERVDCACNYISLIEQGKKFPSPAMLERLAEALAVESYELFQGPEKDAYALDDVKEDLLIGLESAVQDVFARYV
jgi:transcriptional regulator with XRE-family HTH domain